MLFELLRLWIVEISKYFELNEEKELLNFNGGILGFLHSDLVNKNPRMIAFGF